MLIQKQFKNRIFEQLKKNDGVNADDAQSLFVLTISEKIKEASLILSQGNVTVL